jgi:uncharacterized protein YjiS (DUF1127 family)
MNGDTVNRKLPLIVTEVVHRPPARVRSMGIGTVLWSALARWWRGYRSETALMNARDDMLKDMGLTRAEIEHWISGRPYL